MKWAKELVDFLPGERLKELSGKEIEAFLASLGKRKGITDWQVRQAEHALRILHEIFLPRDSPTSASILNLPKKEAAAKAKPKGEGFRDRVIRVKWSDGIPLSLRRSGPR